jgi:hypothetical protein
LDQEESQAVTPLRAPYSSTDRTSVAREVPAGQATDEPPPKA